MTEKKEIFKKLIGKKILEARHSTSSTQEEFAHRIGLSKNNLSKIERGIHLPGERTLIRLVAEYDIDVTKIVQEVREEWKSLFPDEPFPF